MSNKKGFILIESILLLFVISVLISLLYASISLYKQSIMNEGKGEVTIDIKQTLKEIYEY